MTSKPERTRAAGEAVAGMLPHYQKAIELLNSLSNVDEAGRQEQQEAFAELQPDKCQTCGATDGLGSIGEEKDGLQCWGCFVDTIRREERERAAARLRKALKPYGYDGSPMAEGLYAAVLGK